MSGVVGSNISSKGLLYYLDSASPRCYTSGSSICNNLVNNETGSIYSGVSFSGSEAAGSWAFDGGANATIEIPPLENVEDFTISVWFKITGTGTVGSALYSTLIGNTVAGDNRLLVHNTLANRPITVDFATPDDITLTNSTSSIGEWNNAVFTYNNTTGTGSIYTNTVLSPTSLENSNISFNDSMHWLGGSNFPTANYSMKGYISNCAIYNRVLSSSEIVKNYNALKTRFSL
tara:strand:- start:255 stop:950 length:696 start_codon:yes stop_codon:yes gene_type:complete